jgi:hypothetical protein
LKGGIPYASKEKSGRQEKGSSQEKDGDQEKGNQQEKTLRLVSTEGRCSSRSSKRKLQPGRRSNSPPDFFAGKISRQPRRIG